MISFEQLQRFSRECLRLQRALEETPSISKAEKDILKSIITVLITELEQKIMSHIPPAKADGIGSEPHK